MRPALLALHVVLQFAVLAWRRIDDALLRWTLPPCGFPWHFLGILTAMAMAATTIAAAMRQPRFDGRTHCHFVPRPAEVPEANLPARAGSGR